MSHPKFIHYTFTGADASKFLQGQVTLHVERLTENSTQYTAICDLKGRVHFGLWLTKHNAEQFDIVVVEDQKEDFSSHIKKYAAFAKAALVEVGEVFPHIHENNTIFLSATSDIQRWQEHVIEHGQAWISQATEHLFQPQELRLHQRNGVHYDKGCYLGQEIIARLWFKAQPKQWLHLVKSTQEIPNAGNKIEGNIQIVNMIQTKNNEYIALIIAKPTTLEETSFLEVIELPSPLNEDVARAK